MFEINYRIIPHEWDEFKGQEGYIQFCVNGYIYGDMYSKDLDGVMDTEDLNAWFDRICRALYYLEIKNYVVLSDIESNNVWIEFKRMNDDVIISILDNEKMSGVKDVELVMKNPTIHSRYWGNQIVPYDELKRQVISTVKGYIEFLNMNNQYDLMFRDLINDYNKLLEKLIDK